MIQIGSIRNLALIGFSIMGERDERLIVYDIYDMDFMETFVMVESIKEDEIRVTEFLRTIAILNRKEDTYNLSKFEKYLPMEFSVATSEGEITDPEKLIVIDNPSNIDEEKIKKCMDYLNHLKK
ncbi:hypothetical protein [Methanobrevibacter sp.]|uniref:hypothetical protein n=1 Tax=Methanobrevibacter sp. TaxID=66852 RepID=UPI003870861E